MRTTSYQIETTGNNIEVIKKELSRNSGVKKYDN